MKTFLTNLACAFGFAILGTILIISPVAMIHDGPYGLFIHWQETAFYIVAAVASFLAGLFGFRLAKGVKEVKQQRFVVFGFLLVGYLYIACAALCIKIHFGAHDTQSFRDCGLALVIVGTIIRLSAIFTLGRFHSGFVALQKDHLLVKEGIYKYLRHPSYLGGLIAAAGVPMVFGAWFPLLAMPGIYVMLKWRMNAEEQFLVQEFGDEYKAYQEATWRLIPFIY